MTPSNGSRKVLLSVMGALVLMFLQFNLRIGSLETSMSVRLSVLETKVDGLLDAGSPWIKDKPEILERISLVEFRLNALEKPK